MDSLPSSVSETEGLLGVFCELEDDVMSNDGGILDISVMSEVAGVIDSVKVVIAGEETKLVKEATLFVSYNVNDGNGILDVIMGTGCPLGPMVKVGKPGNP